ncbi:MAG: 50S ribosomal protein L18 [Candidatus Bathyarchaeia archaeon]
MAKGPRYRVSYRRRREKKTDYQARRTMATAGIPRFVVRPSNKNIVIQIVDSEIEGDRVLTQTSSAELVKRFGWLGGRKNTPAAYLLGLIAGYKAVAGGIEAAILDVGLKRPTKGSKLFAAVKGAMDAGLKIPCGSGVVPGAERIEGATIAEYAQRLMEDLPAYERRFSDYLRRGLRPERLTDHFGEVKAKIMEAFAG